MIRYICFAALAASALLAQPVVYTGGVVNAASFTNPALPNGAVAQGSLFTIFGERMGPATAATLTSEGVGFPLPTSLVGTSVRVTAGGQNFDCFPVVTSAGQVSAILPSRVPTGQASLTVTYNGQTSAPVNFQVGRSSLGIFSLSQNGQGPGIFQNVVSESNRPFNGPRVSARPGQVIIAWGTGLGPIAGNDGAGPSPGDLTGDIEVYVGGKRAAVSYKGRSGCCAGIDQIVFTVPADVEGCFVPVILRSGGVVANATTIAVERNGNSCSNARGLSSTDHDRAASGAKIGIISLNRSSFKLSITGLPNIPGLPIPTDIKTDLGAASFLNQTVNDATAESQAEASVVGSCTVIPIAPGASGTTPAPRLTTIDAGNVINVRGPRGAKTMTKMAQFPGFYSGNFSGTNPMAPESYLDPGEYTVDNGSGAAGGVGPFTVRTTIPQLLNWTNEASITTVNRSQDLQITWSGGDANAFAVIFGVSLAGASGNSPGAAFSCLERASVGRFTVPSYILGALPVSGTAGGGGVEIPLSQLAVGLAGSPVRFNASGLDTGYLSWSSLLLKGVTYR